MSNMKIVAILFGHEFNVKFVRSIVLADCPRKIIHTYREISRHEHDNNMNITARYHTPKVLYNRRERRFSGNIRIDRILNTNLRKRNIEYDSIERHRVYFHMWRIDVTVKIVFRRYETYACIIVRYNIDISISMFILE
jgi:hypothetical protein